MSGTRVRLIKLEGSLGPARALPPGEWRQLAAACREVAERRGLLADEVLAAAEAMWADYRRRGATSLDGMVERLAADKGQTVAEFLAKAERWFARPDETEGA